MLRLLGNSLLLLRHIHRPISNPSRYTRTRELSGFVTNLHLISLRMASSDPPDNSVADSGQTSLSAESVTKETSVEQKKEERVETGDNGKGEKAESPMSSSDPAKVEAQAVDGAEPEGSTPPPLDSSSDAEKDGTDMSKSATEKLEGDKGSQPGKGPGEKIEQPENEAGGKEKQVKETVGKKEDDPHGKKETKSSSTSSHKSPSAKPEASKPWSFFRSSTSPVETREYFENLSLGDKRKLYYCGSKYKQLKDIQTWPVFQAANGCKSTRTLRNPKQADPSINCKLSLWRGDITSLEIDAIVNAANTSLLGGGGVDGAIHDAAGRSLRRECMELNGCSTGNTKITGGHRLPAKFILHTVGPIGEHRDQLKSCYERCLELVERHKIKSVAFCCISTGIYGYPNTGAAVLALGAVRNWFESSQYAKNEMERVIFCVFLKVDYEIYSELMCLFFPTSSPDSTSSLPDKEGSTGCEEREGKEKTPPVNPESPASNSPSQPPTGVPHLKESMTAPPALMRQELGASGGAEGGCSKEGVEDSPGAREGGEGADVGENKTRESEVSSSNPEVEGGEPNAKQPKLEGEVPPSDPIAPVSAPTDKERNESASPTTTGIKEDS